MKQIFIVAVLGAVLIASLGAHSAHALSSFENNLWYGMAKNVDVQNLQQFLAAQGVYTGPVSGEFQSKTLAGVKAFQAREGISATGYFGQLSRARANAILSEGTVSPERAAMIELLNSLLVQVARLQGQLAALQYATTTPVSTTPSGATTTPPATVTPAYPLVSIEAISPTMPATIGISGGQTIGVFKVTNNGTSAIYLQNVTFANSGVATTSVTYDLRASANGISMGDASIVYVAGNPTAAVGYITASPAAKRRIDGGSWRFLTIRTVGVAAPNDTFQLAVTAVGNVTYSVNESDLGYNANPSVNSTLTDTITGLPMTGLPTLATVTARN